MIKETIQLRKFTRPTKWVRDKIGEVFRSDTGNKIAICTPWNGWVTVTASTVKDDIKETLLRLMEVVFERNIDDYYVDLELNEEVYNRWIEGEGDYLFDAAVRIGLPYTLRGADRKPFDPEDYKGLDEFGEF